MNTIGIGTVALAMGLAVSGGAVAQAMSENQYRLGVEDIAARYTSDQSACTGLAGNANDICKARARGNEIVATAQLEARYKPSEDSLYNLLAARADADYAVAKERCDDKAGNLRDVCLKEAKAAEVATKANATAQLKTANANARAAEASSKATSKASERVADARKDAASDKRDADYAVAKEKCDAYAAGVKSDCLKEAKARFGQN